MTWTKALLLACLVVVAVAGTVSAQPTGCSTVAPGIVDGTFEAGDPWPAWVQTSTNFGSPICDFDLCGNGMGAAPPFAGNNWAFFGGIMSAENSMIRQNVTIPPGPFLFVRFQMRIVAVVTPFTDTLVVRVDSTNVQTFTEPSTPEPAYTERFVNVTPFANGLAHSIQFVFTHPAGNIATFTVDDVSLVSCTTPV